MKTHTFLRQRVYHDGRQMIVAKKGDKREVPDELLNDFVRDETIVKPKGWKDPESDPEADDDDGPQITSDGTGNNSDGLTVSPKSPGRWLITGPGMEDETVTGKREDADKRLAEIRAERAAGSEGPPAE